MSRPGRRSLCATAAVAALLVVPAAARAETYTVSPGAGACGGADLACGGLAEAAAAPAVSGDVFNMSAGSYSGGNFATGGITITGAAGVLVNSTLQFSGDAGGVSRVSNLAVVQSASTGPGVLVSGASGLELADAVVASAADHGILVAAGAANKIQRTIVATGGAGSSAIRVQSGPGPDKGLLAESVLTSGGAQGIGAFTTAAGLTSAGDITLTLRHITAAGSTNGVVLDSNAGVAGLGGGGDIAATMTDSIAFPNVVRNQPGLLGLAANSATLGGSRNLTAGDKAAIFANPAVGNYRLRPGSPAIGQGAIEAGESPSDIDREDRAAAPTDLGADEFNNAPPVAKIAVKTATPRATQAVTFDAGGSSDREAGYGGGITQYQWTFSDGKGEVTTVPTVDHAFPKEGAAAARLVVVDRQGAQSAPATVALKLIDGTPPAVGIVKPRNNQRIKLFTTNQKTKRRTRTKIVFGGLSRDANGIAQVVLTLEKIKRGSSKSRQCNFFDPKKGILSKSCQRPVLIVARLKPGSTTGEWSYTIKRRLTRGAYRLTAVGVDKTGASGNAGGATVGVRRFRLI